MKLRFTRSLFILFIALFSTGALFAQFEAVSSKVIDNYQKYTASNLQRRSVSKPTSCKSDTSLFVQQGTTGWRFVTLRSGSSLGQFYGAPQSMTISGFRFYAFANPVTPARQVFIRLRCNLYKAGADSLPTGTPLASDTVTVDTILRSTFYISDVLFNAVFKNPVTLNYNYILAVECDSTNVTAALMTNDWARGDGKKRNLGCGSVSGKWYRNLQLNISGTAFDADVQLCPFVKYDFGTDFNITNNCYSTLDTIRFQNLQKNSVVGAPYYNYYNYLNLSQFSHRWRYDNGFDVYIVDGKFKPTAKKNFDVRLISTVYTYMSGSCNDTVVKTVFFRPSTPVLKRSATACRGDSVSLDVSSDAGVKLKWYRKITDTAFLTGSSYIIKNAQSNDSFFVRAENGPCNSAFLKIMFTVADYPNSPTVKNDSICQGAAANLQAKSNLGEIEWFSQSTGGPAVFKGELLQTDKLFSDTSFFVQANNKGCINKGGRVQVRALVGSNFAPLKPVIVEDSFVCLNSVTQHTFKASGADTIRWYDVPAGGKPIAKGNEYKINLTGRATYEYYVEVWNGICASSREHTTLRVYNAPAISGLSNKTICNGDSAAFKLAVPWGDINWYESKGASPVYTGSSPVFKELTKNTTYYIQSFENACVASKFDSVRITVNTPPAPVSATSDAVCAKGAGVFKVNVNGGNVWWFYEDTSSTAFYKGNTLTTGSLLSPVTYYYATENQGCYSAKKPLTVNIKPRPTAGFTWQVRWKFQVICTPITTTGITFEWQWGDGSKTTGLPGVHAYAKEGPYTVRLIVTSTSNGCKDTADIPVLIDHTGTELTKAESISAYPVPAVQGQVLNLSGLNNRRGYYTLYALNGSVAGGGLVENGQLRLPTGLPTAGYVLLLKTPDKIYKCIISVVNP